MFKDIYKETSLIVAWHIACPENKWMSSAWRRENTKEENSIVEEAMKAIDNIGVDIQFEEGNIWRVGELMETSVEEIGGQIEKGS